MSLVNSYNAINYCKSLVSSTEILVRKGVFDRYSVFDVVVCSP